jgi:hypothetical protein
MAVELAQVTSITDFIQTDHFTLELPALPGGGDRDAFVIRNLTAVLPGRSNQVVKGEIHRFTINRAGKPIWPQEFQASYMDTPDKKILSGIQNWMNLNSDPETGLPQTAARYLTTGVVVLYGMNDAEFERRTFHNLWLSKLADLNLNGATPGMANFNLSFTYDYWTPG